MMSLEYLSNFSWEKNSLQLKDIIYLIGGMFFRKKPSGKIEGKMYHNVLLFITSLNSTDSVCMLCMTQNWKNIKEHVKQLAI